MSRIVTRPLEAQDEGPKLQAFPRISTLARRLLLERGVATGKTRVYEGLNVAALPRVEAKLGGAASTPGR